MTQSPESDPDLNTAIRAHQAGRVHEAERSYRTILSLQPMHPDALHLLGLALHQQGRSAEGIAHIEQAIAVRPNAAFHSNAGIVLRKLGRHAEAEKAFRQALELRPDLAEGWNNLGNLLKELERIPEAEEAFRQALRLRENYAEALSNLGNLLQKQQRFDEAEASFRRSLAARSDQPEARFNLGNLLVTLGRFQEAEECYRHLLRSNGETPDVLLNLAGLLQRLQRLAEAEALLQRLTTLSPDWAEAWNNRGAVLREQGRMEEAEQALRRCLQLRADHAPACNSLGLVLQQRGRLREAEEVLREAVALQPESPEVKHNLASVLEDQGLNPEAEELWRQILQQEPQRAVTALNLAQLLLRQGRFQEGWSLYERRHAAHGVADPPLPCPPWRGEPLDGKRLLVWPEQGIGDAVQCARFAAELKKRGARVLWGCQAETLPLLQRLSGVETCFDIATGPIPPADYWVWMMSLPGRLGVDADHLPAATPYLEVDAERLARWRARLPESRLRVGLVWKGNPNHANDANRSLRRLEQLSPLWRAGEEILFVGLQKGAGQEETMGQRFLALGPELGDLADLAAVIRQLDLVIGVDTAAVHLAGALGVKTWVMLPGIGCDWRWLEERGDSPWYPGMRLFRRGREAGWKEVIEAVAAELFVVSAGLTPVAAPEAPGEEEPLPWWRRLFGRGYNRSDRSPRRSA
ncbi:MAG: tetratricopeptide repeat protein [Magnetococcales bacterium]|nr:tetratricopeptide repeat protein [Magnetococcales bacterium]